MIIGPPSSTNEHFVAASTLKPFRLISDRAVTPGVKGVLSRCASRPDVAVQLLKTALSDFSSLPDVLSPRSARWACTLGEGAPSGGIDIAPIQFLLTHFEYHHDVCAYDVARGIPIAGNVPLARRSPHGCVPRRSRCQHGMPSWSPVTAAFSLALLAHRLTRWSLPAGARRWKKCSEGG